MILFSKASLEQLRARVDLVEVLSPHIKMQRSGASYKALCPFHEEKTPSFIIQKGDTHYHCFGCGAHGDAIQFLMTYLRISFGEAVVQLAERFNVVMEETQSDTPAGPSKSALKEAMEKACQFFQFCLLYTAEGHSALHYLYDRGIDLGWIQQFRIGWAPKSGQAFLEWMHAQKIDDSVLKEAGLLSHSNRPFFFDRVAIPILDAMGSVIGFSARKIVSDATGPKYINTPETPLFKKSHLLFGLSFSRKQMAKDRRALIVEGQIDAMRLIYNGYDWTVAGQGTAFGSDQVRELCQLGVRQVYLALDGDTAGQEATVKIGHLFQKVGVEVWVVRLEKGCDPDLFLQEKGPAEWQKKIDQSIEYIPFLIEHYSKKIHVNTPAGKNELVQTIAQKIREWDHPLMVHESLRKLALLTQTPESIIGVGESKPLYTNRSIQVAPSFDPDRIMEADLLRWLLLGPISESLLKRAQHNLSESAFRLEVSKKVFRCLMNKAHEGKACDLLSLAIDLENADEQLFLNEILQKKINHERALEGFTDSIQRLLDRNWMQEREEIKKQIQSSQGDELAELAKRFDEIKRKRPKVVESE